MSKINESMKQKFKEKAKKIIQQQDAFNNQAEIKIGFESEFSIVNANLDLVNEETRNNIITITQKNLHQKGYKGDLVKYELGAGQIELNTPPVILLTDFTLLEKTLKDFEDSLKLGTTSKNASAMRIGFHPTNGLTDKELIRTTAQKYRIVPTFHDANRGTHIDTILGRKEQVDVAPAAIVSLASSIQFNIQAKSVSDAVDKTNRALMIGPFLLALSGNSRFANGKDTGYSDLRMEAWQKSHDIRTPQECAKGKQYRIGLPDKYYKTIEDYFKDIESFPFILDVEEAAFEIGIGLYWKDTRIKFPTDTACVVESRIVPVQPSVDEDVAMLTYHLGRLQYSQATKEQLIPINKLAENRTSAIQQGLEGHMYQNFDEQLKLVTTREAILEDLKKAKQGLEMLGLYTDKAKEYFKILTDRVFLGNPSDKTAKLFYAKKNEGADNKEALKLATCNLLIK